MLGLQYTKKAMDHWRTWRPNEYKQMKADGTLNEFIQSKSKEAAEQVSNLMQQGLQQHEAEEIVLPETILLPPERPERGE